jgi:hypothetical protein
LPALVASEGGPIDDLDGPAGDGATAAPVTPDPPEAPPTPPGPSQPALTPSTRVNVGLHVVTDGEARDYDDQRHLWHRID